MLNIYLISFNIYIYIYIYILLILVEDKNQICSKQKSNKILNYSLLLYNKISKIYIIIHISYSQSKYF